MKKHPPAQPAPMTDARWQYWRQQIARQRLRMDIRAALRNPASSPTLEVPRYGPEILTLMKLEAQRLAL